MDPWNVNSMTVSGNGVYFQSRSLDEDVVKYEAKSAEIDFPAGSIFHDRL